MLERFLRTLSIDRVTPIGNSLGGWIAGAFALRFPERVNKLALVDAAGVWEGVTELPFDLRVSTREHLADVFRHLFYDKNLATDEHIDLAYQQPEALTATTSSNDGHTVMDAQKNMVAPKACTGHRHGDRRQVLSAENHRDIRGAGQRGGTAYGAMDRQG